MLKSLAAIGTLIALCALPASAKPSAARHVTVEYHGPNTVSDDDYYVTNIGPMAKPKAGERAVQVDIVDASGRPVLAEIRQGSVRLAPAFCGHTRGPVKLRSRGSLRVHLFVGPGCGQGSLPTTGTIELSFED